MADDPSSVPPTIQRPLSPHLQIYKVQISTTLSILHRITGMGLVLCAVALAAWVTALAYHPQSMDDVRPHLHSWWAIAIMVAFSFAFYYHLANGIRHLFWDIGKGFTLSVMHRTGVFVILFALATTATTWWWIFRQGAE